MEQQHARGDRTLGAGRVRLNRWWLWCIRFAAVSLVAAPMVLTTIAQRNNVTGTDGASPHLPATHFDYDPLDPASPPQVEALPFREPAAQSKPDPPLGS